MSITFKFRSCINFEYIEIEGDEPHLSVGGLRTKILCKTKLNNLSPKNFNLVLSDALTGQEYNGDRFKIPSGSSVIVKRVPVEPVRTAISRYQRVEASELRDDMPKGLDQNKPEKEVPEEKLELDSDKQIKFRNMASAKSMDLLTAGLPPELRCPLCNTYFKEAVMIPCCQRSFCEKCIREVLVVKRSCPWCSSTNSRVEDLLPNFCLRQTIKFFLESQIRATSQENDLQKYVPESGIQGKDISSAVPMTGFFDSTSAMEEGSNQDMAEFACASLNVKNSLFKGSGKAIGVPKSISLLSAKHDDRDRPKDLAPAADSRDINQPLDMPQAHMPVLGGDQRCAIHYRNRKVGRTCYMCGSPYHLIRDCPIALNRHPMCHAGDPMFQRGIPCYATSYWSGAVYPYMNMYRSPGMVPLGGNMVPGTHYRHPRYLPSIYSDLPVPSGTMMGGLAAPMRTIYNPFTPSRSLEPLHGDNRRNFHMNGVVL